MSIRYTISGMQMFKLPESGIQISCISMYLAPESGIYLVFKYILYILSESGIYLVFKYILYNTTRIWYISGI